MLGDLNGWVGDRVRVGITCVFGVSGENGYGRRVVDFCSEGGQDEVEAKNMIDLVLVNKNMMHYVQNVRAGRGIGRVLSYHL